MVKKEVSKEVQEKIAQACKEVVMRDEVVKLQGTLQQQMNIAKQQLVQAQQQVVLWDTKMKQFSGSIAVCNEILQKSQKVKSIELASDNTKPEKK